MCSKQIVSTTDLSTGCKTKLARDPMVRLVVGRSGFDSLTESE